MRILIIALLTALQFGQLFSQQATLEKTVSLVSPHNTIYTHLYFLQPETFDVSKAAQTIYGPEYTQNEKEDIAIRIKTVLDARGLYIDINLIPKAENYTDSIYNKHVFFLPGTEEKIYVELIDSSWYYGGSTINNIEALYQETFPFGAKFFQDLLPQKIASMALLGLKLWQWVGIIMLILLAFILIYLLKIIANRLINLYVSNRSLEDEPVLVENAAKALSLVITFYFLLKLVPSIQLPVQLSQYVVKAFKIVVILLFANLAIKISAILIAYGKKLALNTTSKLDDQLIPILRKLSRLFIGIIAFALILKQLDVDLMAIIAGLSVGALALALAAQDTVKNFIGSITIFLDKPFEIGDFIIAGGIEGTVEEVGIRATRLRTANQSVAYIPNGNLSGLVIDNLGLRIYRRWKSQLGLEYDTDPKTIEAFIERVKEILKNRPEVFNDKTQVRLSALGASSLDITMDAFLDVSTYSEDIRCREEVLLEILTLAKEMKVEFAFPTQTLHLKKES